MPVARVNRFWLPGGIITLMVLGAGAVFWLALYPARELFAKDVQAAWEGAGAGTGGMMWDAKAGDLNYRETPFLSEDEWQRFDAGEMVPSFRIDARQLVATGPLPGPDRPFGLWVTGELTNETWDELAKYENLVMLVLPGTDPTGKALEHLVALRGLRVLDLEDKRLSDGMLRVLRKSGRLHLLPQAFGPEGARPATDEEIVSLKLAGTRVATEGLKEFASLKALSTLDLKATLLSDNQVLALNEGKMLHLLTQATDFDGSRAPSDDMLRSIDLQGTRVTYRGIKEFASLKNLSTVCLGPAQVTDEVLQVLYASGKLHTLTQAKDRSGKRPASDHEISSMDLRDTQVTGAGLEGVSLLPNLTELDLRELRITRLTTQCAKALREKGLLHALPLFVDGGLSRHYATTDNELRHLEARNLHGTSTALKELFGLPNLSLISIHVVTDDVLKALGELGRLHLLRTYAESDQKKQPMSEDDIVKFDLHDDWMAVSAAGIRELSCLKNLKTLRLGEKHLAWDRFTVQVYLSPDMLEALSTLKNLTTLDLREAGLGNADTATMEAALRKHLPNCRIVR